MIITIIKRLKIHIKCKNEIYTITIFGVETSFVINVVDTFAVKKDVHSCKTCNIAGVRKQNGDTIQ